MTSSDGPALALHGAGRTYGSGHTEVVALHPTDLAIDHGELVAVMGPSGSGKSTLLTLAGGLETPTTGRVEVEGIDLAGMSRTDLAVIRRRTLGYVFQELNLMQGLTARENVMLPLELDEVATPSARRQADEVLAAVGLSDLADRFPEDLSGGEQQRVAIARAMVGDRRVVLADEPTGALDSVAGEVVLRLLRDHCDAGAAGVIVTHDAAQAAWADRVVFLRDGRMVDQAGPGPGPGSLLAEGVRP